MLFLQERKRRNHILVLILRYFPQNQIGRPVRQVVLILNHVFFPCCLSLLQKNRHVFFIFLPYGFVSPLKFFIGKDNKMFLFSFSQNSRQNVPLSADFLMTGINLMPAVYAVVEKRLSEPEIISRSGTAVIQISGRHGYILLVNRVNLSIF